MPISIFWWLVIRLIFRKLLYILKFDKVFDLFLIYDSEGLEIVLFMYCVVFSFLSTVCWKSINTFIYWSKPREMLLCKILSPLFYPTDLCVGFEPAPSAFPMINEFTLTSIYLQGSICQTPWSCLYLPHSGLWGRDSGLIAFP